MSSMRKSQRSFRNKNTRRVNRPNRKDIREHVSQYTAAPMQNRKFRFQASTAGGYNITNLELSRLLGVGNGANSVYPLYSSYKLNRVQIWSSGNSGDLKLDPISLVYFGGTDTNTGTNKRITDYGNANHFAYISESPGKDTLASFWKSGTSTEILLQLAVNVGDIIDIDVSIIADGNNEVTAYTSIATAGAGVIYALALDNGSSSHLTPAENSTIV
jgi:hypothetical protein